MLLEIFASVILLACVVMTAIPTLPGIPLMFVVTVVYGFLDHFHHLAPAQLMIFGAITLVSVGIDWSSGLVGAKIGGATRTSLLVGIVSMVVGLLTFPPLGAFVGLFLGIFIAEVVQRNDHAQAFKASVSSVAAAIAGVIANIVLALGYFITFLVIVL